MGINTTVIPKQINLSDVVDNETITYDVENNKLKVNIVNIDDLSDYVYSNNDSDIYAQGEERGCDYNSSYIKAISKLTIPSNFSNNTTIRLKIYYRKTNKNFTTYFYIYKNGTSSSNIIHSNTIGNVYSTNMYYDLTVNPNDYFYFGLKASITSDNYQHYITPYILGKSNNYYKNLTKSNTSLTLLKDITYIKYNFIFENVFISL